MWREMLAGSIDAACKEERFVLNAFVFMPEHVHLLVLPDDAESNVSRLLVRLGGTDQ
jgi:putative transposase